MSHKAANIVRVNGSIFTCDLALFVLLLVMEALRAVVGRDGERSSPVLALRLQLGTIVVDVGEGYDVRLLSDVEAYVGDVGATDLLLVRLKHDTA